MANVPMLLDTGADITLLPRQCIDQLQIPSDPSQAYELIGFDGSRSTAMAVHHDLIFLGLTFRGRFAVTDWPTVFAVAQLKLQPYLPNEVVGQRVVHDRMLRDTLLWRVRRLKVLIYR